MPSPEMTMQIKKTQKVFDVKYETQPTFPMPFERWSNMQPRKMRECHQAVAPGSAVSRFLVPAVS